MQSPVERLPQAIYSAAQVRELDRAAIEQHGIPDYELMCRAGRSALDVLRSRWPSVRNLAVYCGAGNNAGDGYVLARFAATAGIVARIAAVVSPERLRGAAAQAFRDCRAAGVPILRFDEFEAVSREAGFEPDVVADGLLGTGLDRTVQGDFARAVAAVNESSLPVLALDIPSGLHADTGHVLGHAVRADVTITFVGLKQGLFLGEAPDYCGRIEFADLGVPRALAASLPPALERLTLDDLRRTLPPRRPSAHKGTHGRLLLVGSGPGMPGAIRLAAEGALRAGAGLVYVGTHASSVPIVMAGRPEIICRPIERARDLDALIDLCDGVVIGPGLGRSDWSRTLWERVMRVEQPLVVDADGLNLLAEQPSTRADWLLTPHIGEASRLLNRAAAEIQGDRYRAALDLAQRFSAAAVLKGPCSLVVTAGEGPEARLRVGVCDRGNPGMASAGVGDVLSGVLGGLLVQTGDLARATRAGVLLHALAGDDAAEQDQRGTIASDLMPFIRRWANP